MINTIIFGTILDEKKRVVMELEESLDDGDIIRLFIANKKDEIVTFSDEQKWFDEVTITSTNSSEGSEIVMTINCKRLYERAGNKLGNYTLNAQLCRASDVLVNDETEQETIIGSEVVQPGILCLRKVLPLGL